MCVLFPLLLMCAKLYLSRAFTPICVSSVRVVNELSEVEYIKFIFVHCSFFFFFSSKQYPGQSLSPNKIICLNLVHLLIKQALAYSQTISLTYHFLIYSKIMIVYIVRGSATLRPVWSWDHHDLKKKIIYNNLKKFSCLPFKKKFGNTLNFLCK